MGRGLRPGVYQGLHLLPVSDQGWVNGHEWARRQAAKAGIGFTALSNGFATCDDPAALQAICDRLGPGTIEVFFQRWLAHLPLPLTDAGRAAGYWWELSMRQVEVSRTLVFTAPRHARRFFETLVSDNLGTGRPDEISLIFDRRIRSDTEGTPPARGAHHADLAGPAPPPAPDADNPARCHQLHPRRVLDQLANQLVDQR